MAKSKRKQAKTMKICRNLKRFKLFWSIASRSKTTFISRRNPNDATNHAVQGVDPIPIPIPPAVQGVDPIANPPAVQGADPIPIPPAVQGVYPIIIPRLWYIDPTSNKAMWNADVNPSTYSKVDATLALTYPPAFLFREGKFTDEKFKITPNCTLGFGLHGAFEPPGTKTVHENMEKAEFHFENPFIDRLNKAMPYVGRYMCQRIIDRERRKHGKNLDFLTHDSYPIFAVDLYEQYEFDRLLSFVFTTLRETDIPIWEYSCYREDWIGIRLGDLASICEVYPPICNGERKLTFRLVDSDVFENHFFPYELHIGVTKVKEIMPMGHVGCLVGDDKKNPSSPDSIILLLSK